MSEEHEHRHHHGITLAIALIALLAACVLPFLMRDRLQLELRESTRALTTEQEKISGSLDALKTTLDSLSNKATPDAESVAELKRTVAETSTMLEVISTRLDEIEKKAAEKKPEPAPTATIAPAQPLPTAAIAATAPAAPSSSFNTLKLAVLSGNAYATELTAWEKSQGASTKAPASLSAFAQNGMPSEATLMRDLRAALTAAQTPAAVDDVSLAGKINTHLAGLVSIKKTKADSPYTALMRDIDRAELATLMHDVAQLDEPARAPLADWLRTATARAEALSALGTLEPKDGL